MLKSLNRLSGKAKVVVAVIYIALFASYPYVFARFFNLPELTYFMAFELVALVLLGFSIKKSSSLPKALTYICLVQSFIFFFLFVIHWDTFYLLRFIVFVIISYLSLFVVNNTVGIVKFVSINNFWLVLQVVLGVIGFFLIAANLISPLLTYAFPTYGYDYFYGITTSNAIIGNIPRIAGYFDEPGALAQWGVYALVLNKISPQYNKRVELTLILGLFVTFSMAYFIQLFLYLIVFNFTKLKKLLPVVFILLVGFFVARNYIPEDSDLYSLTFKRFELTDGQLETNRDNSSKIAKAYFKSSPIFGMGYTNLVDKGVYFFDNPYETLATSGIIGTFALYLPLILILFKYRKKGSWQAVMILGVGYLQRPFHIQYIHYLMMYLLFLMCYYNNQPHKRLSLES